MKLGKFKNEEDGEIHKMHGSFYFINPIEEIEKLKKENLKKQKKNKKKNKGKEKQEEKKTNGNEAGKQKTHTTPHKNPLPYETEEVLVGYGTNAMIFNNCTGESESSEEEGIEDYKIGGYHAIHVGYFTVLYK